MALVGCEESFGVRTAADRAAAGSAVKQRVFAKKYFKSRDTPVMEDVGAAQKN